MLFKASTCTINFARSFRKIHSATQAAFDCNLRYAYQVEIGQRLQEAIQEKKRAAILSIGSAALLLGLKTFLVLRTSSLGVLSEALHSGLDLVAAVITFLSVRVSDQPADERHPYGHGKFENFSAFMETGLLILTAIYIIYEAFSRLFFRSVHIQPSLLAILVLFIALAIDMTRSRALNAVARKYTSEALEADALHFSTDVWSTTVVIAGVALVWPGTTGICHGLLTRTRSRGSA